MLGSRTIPGLHLSIRTVSMIGLSGVLAAIAGAGCTFGGLANYTIQPCDPTQPQSTDVCDRLNTDPATCEPYQCDSTTRHCTQKVRDDDRDGDPSTTCGGTDCDDQNATRSGTTKEICDGIDNDCDGVIDEEVLVAGAERTVAPIGALTSSSDPILVPSDDARRNVLAARIDGTCLPFVALEPGSGGPVGSGCAVSDPNVAPHQPYPLRTSTGNAAAFIATSACVSGRLAYRVQSSGLASFDLPCDKAHPAALPAAAAMPSTANASSGILAWYEGALAGRSDPVGDCATVEPVPLAILAVPSLASPEATASADQILRAPEKSAATRPPALLAVEAAGGMLLTTPLGADVGIVLLTPASLTSRTFPAPVHVPLAGAHATALAMRVENDTVHIAIAAEIGCRPQAGIALALGTLDPKSGAMTFAAPIEIAAAGEIATMPSVAWIPARAEWWVGWVDAIPHARVRRVSAAGVPIGGAIDVGTALPLATVSAGESVFGLDPNVNGGSFVEIPLGCPKSP